MEKEISNKLDVLYVKFTPPKSVSEFIETFLRSYNNNTYIDPEYTKKQHTGYWGWRSINDLYILVKTYYPTTTLKEILNIVIKLELNFGYCTTIRRKILYYHSSKTYYWSVLPESWKKLFSENGITEDIFDKTRKSL